MFIEHIFFSTALAVIVGMVTSQFFRRDHSWIIIVSSLAPDVDAYLDVVRYIGEWAGGGLFAGKVYIYAVFPLSYHGDLHNLVGVVGYAALLAIILPQFGVPRVSAFILGAIGFGAHLFEDALVYPPGYQLLWPLTDQGVGFNVLPGLWDWYHLANEETLRIGILVAITAILIRMSVEGTSWIAGSREPQRAAG
jgi:hypothetical protein